MGSYALSKWANVGLCRQGDLIGHGRWALGSAWGVILAVLAILCGVCLLL